MSTNDGATGKSNGRRAPDEKVRVAIVGVGNCASSFVQGVEYYRDADPDQQVPGLMHVDLGGYHVSDIEFTAAFDIDVEKVGKDLSEAIFCGQNNTVKFSDVPNLGVPVHRGMTHDGLGKYLKQKITKAPGETVPIIGDDIKSQVGATIVHRQLARLFEDRGVKIERTSQLNVGGNMDFYNMLERERLESKKISKTRAVTSIVSDELKDENVYIGPSDYVSWLEDRKWAHIRLEGRSFGDVPLNLELKLEVVDSPNSAGIVIDAVRIIKLALNNGIAGELDGPSSYLMKSPHTQRPDSEARDATEKFIDEHARKAASKVAKELAPERAEP